MGEILEKGLMIGFGLITLVVFFSIFSPYFGIIFNQNQKKDEDNINLFIWTLNYGLNYSPDNADNNLVFNFTLYTKVSLNCEIINNHYQLDVSSIIKNSTIESDRIIILNNSTISGDILIEFSYFNNSVELIFRGVNFD